MVRRAVGILEVMRSNVKVTDNLVGDGITVDVDNHLVIT